MDTPAVVLIWEGPGGEPAQQNTTQVVGGKLRQVSRLTDTQTNFLKAHSPGPFKMTVPNPDQFPAIRFQQGLTDEFYVTRSDPLQDIVEIIKAEITTLIDESSPYIKMDTPRYTCYVDPRWRQYLRDQGDDPDQMFEEAIAADNACLEGIDQTETTAAFHIFRGNNQSKWYAQGGYRPMAEKLFGELTVNRFLLEYDTQRAGTFEPLRFVPNDKMVCWAL